MFWDFDDDFWDFDPEDFAVVGGVVGLVEEEIEKEDIWEKECERNFEEVEDDL